MAPGKGDPFWKLSCSGSMLNFGVVLQLTIEELAGKNRRRTYLAMGLRSLARLVYRILLLMIQKSNGSQYPVEFGS